MLETGLVSWLELPSSRNSYEYRHSSSWQHEQGFRSWEKPDSERCSNAASDDVAPRIWRRQHSWQHSIMKTRSVSISHYKSKEILEEWLACQWFFHVAFSFKFLSSLARAACVLGVYVSSRRQIFFAWMSLHGLSDSKIMLSFGNRIWRCETTIKARVQLQKFP